jgi:steroid delta-isomerase-like uncharacterized protein
MSIEQNKAIARRLTEEVFNRGNLAAVDEIMASDYVNHSAPPNLPRGAAGTKAFVSMFRAGFPDLHITIEDMVAEGDKVAVRHVTRGTHLGVFLGIQPTGRSVEVSGIDMVRISSGQIAEGWGIIDQLGLMQQLGVGPKAQR